MAALTGCGQDGAMIEMTREQVLLVDEMVEPPYGHDPGSGKAHANTLMRDGLRRLDQDELIPFFCECDRGDCLTAVWLSGSAFDRLRESSALVRSDHCETSLPLASC